MAKKYQTRRYDLKITEVEIVRETEACVWVTRRLGNGGERRESKVTDYEQYHDSWDAAKKFLVDRELAKVERLKAELQKARTASGQADSLQNPVTIAAELNQSASPTQSVQDSSSFTNVEHAEKLSKLEQDVAK